MLKDIGPTKGEKSLYYSGDVRWNVVNITDKVRLAEEFCRWKNSWDEGESLTKKPNQSSHTGAAATMSQVTTTARRPRPRPLLYL